MTSQDRKITNRLDSIRQSVDATARNILARSQRHQEFSPPQGKRHHIASQREDKFLHGSIDLGVRQEKDKYRKMLEKMKTTEPSGNNSRLSNKNEEKVKLKPIYK